MKTTIISEVIKHKSHLDIHKAAFASSGNFLIFLDTKGAIHKILTTTDPIRYTTIGKVDLKSSWSRSADLRIINDDKELLIAWWDHSRERVHMHKEEIRWKSTNYSRRNTLLILLVFIIGTCMYVRVYNHYNDGDYFHPLHQKNRLFLVLAVWFRSSNC